MRRSAFYAASALTLVAGFYIVEDWRGRRAWERCEQELRSQGAQLDWPAFIPSRAPDDQNFMKTPLMEAVMFQGRIDTNVWQPLSEAGRFLVWEAGGDAQAGRRIDWTRYQSELRHKPNVNLPAMPQEPAADLLRLLEGIETQLDDLRNASVRPLAQFDIDRTAPFEESPALNFVAIRKLAQLLANHAFADLALGNHERAFVDVRVIHRLSDALHHENTLVTMMMRAALQGLAMEPFWEGWVARQWTDRELAEFETLFGRVDLVPEFSRVMSAERAGVIGLLQKYGIQKNELWRVTMRNDDTPRSGWGAAVQKLQKLGWSLAPRGWAYQNLVSYSHRMQVFMDPSFTAKPPTIPPSRVEEIQEQTERGIPSGVYGFISRMGIPNGGKALKSVSRVQNFVNQGRIVCALERYRMAQGHYPASLNELVPKYIDQLPMDLISGKPMNYRLTNETKFTLYSVGWNMTDDGGTPTPPNQEAPRFELQRGDWVWPYPTGK